MVLDTSKLLDSSTITRIRQEYQKNQVGRDGLDLLQFCKVMLELATGMVGDESE